MEAISKTLAQTNKIAQELIRTLKPTGDAATVIGLYGQLGSGKTTFSKALATALGVIETVTSPTFVIEKIYQLPADQKFNQLIHIDCYRLEKSRELDILDFDNLSKNPKNLIIIEWPEKIKDVLPPNHPRVFFEFVDNTTRKIIIK